MRVKQQIKAVVFDVGGVLLRLGEAEYRREAAQRLGMSDLPQLYYDMNPQVQRGDLDEAAVWREAIGKDVDPDDFADIWIRRFTPAEEMLAFADELRGLGVRTGIYSNTQDSHVRFMHRMGFFRGFDPLCFSCEIGFRKPEPEGYHVLLGRLCLPASAVVFVDDLPENVEAALAVGIHGVHHGGDVSLTRSAILRLIR